MTITPLFTTLNNLRGIIALAAILKWMSFHVWLVHEWFGMDLSVAIWDSVVSNTLLIVCCLVSSNSLNAVPRAGKFWFALGLGLIMAVACLWLSDKVLQGVAGGSESYISFLEKAAPVRTAFNFFVIAGASIASIFYFQWVEQEEVSRRESATLAMIREAELQKLQQQLQPHFLFNCLNSINAMITIKPEEAKKMVLHLSDFLRITMKRADEPWVALEEEWNYLQLYLSIEKVRFGHRLEVETKFNEPCMQWVIPTLLLQPLVENAIKYGLYGTTDKVTIGIEAAIKNGFLEIKVINPFDQDAQPFKGTGFGLSGLKRRLYLLFARNDLLEIQTLNNKFIVLLKIPSRP